MSRGLGRLERLLLAELAENPAGEFAMRRFIWLADYADESHMTSIYRAARSLRRKHLADGAGGQLMETKISLYRRLDLPTEELELELLAAAGEPFPDNLAQ